jgi:hypothetical protein
MSDNDRRGFFKKMAGAAAALAAAETAGSADGFDTAAESAAAARAFVAGRFALELDGKPAGFLAAVDGGHATSDVIVETLGAGCFARKHLAGVKYGDIEINCGTGMSADFYNWIQGSLECEAFGKDGAIVVGDAGLKEVSRQKFFEAYISEITFPALDAAAKDAASMTVKLAPEVTRAVKGTGTAIPMCGGIKAQKKWQRGSFRLSIDGLDCTHVTAVEAITIKQTIVEVGEFRQPRRTLEFPHLVITLTEASAQSFADWHEDFVIKGNNADESEKSGKLEFLTPNLQTAIFTLEFKHLGIFSYVPDAFDSSESGIRKVKVEMYCEQMSFSYGPTTAAC